MKLSLASGTALPSTAAPSPQTSLPITHPNLHPICVSGAAPQ
jgi:hypothetical protein